MKQAENLIYGIHPVIESLRSGKELDKIFIQKGLRGDQFAELYALLKEAGATVQHVPVEKLNRLTRKNHQGVVAYISAIAYQPIEELVPMIFEKGEIPLIVILDGVTDVRNLGALARTAECAGVHAILVPTQGMAPVNADAMKTSAGALNHIPVCRSKNLSAAIDFLKNSGLQIVSVSEKGEEMMYQPDYQKPTAFILGSEEDGISPAYLKKSDHTVQIPMSGQTESLNVSVAGSVIIYEAVRQRINLD